MGRKAGYKHTQEFKDRQRALRLGKPRPDHVCDKISRTMIKTLRLKKVS